MELEIVKAKKEKVRPYYEYFITFMEGDGDDYKTEILELSVEDQELFGHNLIMALEYLDKSYPNGKGGSDDYEGFSYYDAFFNYSVTNKELNPKNIEINHPGNFDYETIDSLDTYKLQYVDENSNKFDVKVILNEEELKIIENNIKK